MVTTCTIVVSPIVQPTILPKFDDLADVFNKANCGSIATPSPIQFPSHHPYDKSVNLVPDAQVKYCPIIYSLSYVVEMQAQDGTDRLNKLRAGTDED